MKKFWEVTFNSLLYRMISLFIQLLIVGVFFGFVTNWKLVLVCNIVGFAWYMIYHLVSISIRRHIKQGNVKIGKGVSLYLSHPIRGSHGKNPSCKVQMSNCEVADIVASKILKAFPGLKLYVPAHAEKFVYRTFASGLLTDKQILDIDCDIISEECQGVLAYDFDKSKGVEIEVKYARDNKIPVLRFNCFNDEAIDSIKEFIRQLKDSEIK